MSDFISVVKDGGLKDLLNQSSFRVGYNNITKSGIHVNGNQFCAVARVNDDVKDIRNSIVNIKNSTGLNIPLNPFTALVPDKISASYYQLKRFDGKGENYTLQDFIPFVEATQYRSIDKFKLKLMHDVGNIDNANDGITPIGKKSAKGTSANIEYDSTEAQNYQWRYDIGYDLTEVEQGSWVNENIIQEKTDVARRIFNLTTQQRLLAGGGYFEGLLGQTGISYDTSIFSGKSPLAMTDSEYQTWVVKMSNAASGQNADYGLHTNFNTLVIAPEIYIGLQNSFVNPGFAILRRLDYLQQSLPYVEIKALAYCQKNYGGNPDSGYYLYALYAKDPDILRVANPMPYTQLAFGTADNFFYQAVALAQFTDVKVINPKGILYFKHA